MSVCSKMDAAKVPDNWHYVNTCGVPINATNIICFKTPLESKHFEYVTGGDENKWQVSSVVKHLPRLGAVVDLSNNNYYDGHEFEKAGVLYKKINVPSNKAADEKYIQQFIETMDHFKTKCPGMLIGVHCTHGLNRTGFLVCYYIKKRLSPSTPMSEIIEDFEKARGHAIYNEKYVHKLLMNE